MKLHIIELEKLQKTAKIKRNMKTIINIFLSAINDWPNSILSLEDYELDIQIFINGATTKNNLENCLKKIDFSRYAWQAESLIQIIEVYKFYNTDLSLKEIIEDFKNKIGIEKNLI